MISIPQGGGGGSHGTGPGSGLRIDCSLPTPTETPPGGGAGSRHDRQSGGSSSSGVGSIPTSPGGSSWEDAMTQLSRELQVCKGRIINYGMGGTTILGKI